MAATNRAATLAGGEFLLFFDHDDELTPDAVGEVALFLADQPDVDALYSDDDKIDVSGRRYAPQFKPDWSPELLLAYMYLSHVFVVRRALFTSVGGMRVGFEGAQDYDLALRVAERTREARKSTQARRRTARGLPPEPQPGEGRGDNMDQDDDRGDKYDRNDRYDRGDKYEVQR